MTDKQMPAILVYLAGPIDGIHPDSASGWREDVAKAWPEIGFFNPAAAFLNDHEGTIAAIQQIDRAALSLCHGVIANLSGAGRGFGTIREVEYATLRGKPTCVIGDFESSLAIFDVLVATTLDQGMDLLMGEIADRLNQPSDMFVQPIFQIRQEPEPPPDEQ